MSWAKVKKINSNMKTPLNEQIKNALLGEFYVITSSQTFTVPKTGKYRIIAVGAGGSSRYTSSGSIVHYSGASGGVSIKNLDLVAGDEYEINISGKAEGFGITAYPASNDVGGSASGGDKNLSGNDGRQGYNIGASLPIFIVGLTNNYETIYQTTAGTTEYLFKIISGYGLCGLGYGAGYATYVNGSHWQGESGAAGFIIQCLQIEE